jgi:hypothetical protein
MEVGNNMPLNNNIRPRLINELNEIRRPRLFPNFNRPMNLPPNNNRQSSLLAWSIKFCGSWKFNLTLLAFNAISLLAYSYVVYAHFAKDSIPFTLDVIFDQDHVPYILLWVFTPIYLNIRVNNFVELCIFYKSEFVHAGKIDRGTLLAVETSPSESSQQS